MKHWVLSAIVVTVTGGGLFAQSEVERFERQLETIRREQRRMIDESIPADQRALFEYGGLYSLNFLSVPDQDADSHLLWQNDLRGYARLNFDGVHEFLTRVRTTYRTFNDGDGFGSTGDVDWVEPTLDRGYYRFDYQRYLSAYEGIESDQTLTITAGRQLVHWANGLVLSKDLDALFLVTGHENLTVDLLMGITRRSITDIDNSRPKFDDETRRLFVGGKVNYRIGNHQPYIYGLVQDDHNPDDINSVTINNNVGVVTANTAFEYNSYYIGVGSRGNIGDNLLYGVEFAYQGGSGLSRSFNFSDLSLVNQTEEDIAAYAFDVRLDYLLHDANHTRFVGEITVASGDDDRDGHTTNTIGGNKPGTTDTAFNAFGFVNSSLAFAPNVSNLIITRLGVTTQPMPESRTFKHLQLGTDVFVFNRTDSGAPIDEPVGSGNYLGFETDVYANWRVTSDLSLGVRYGVFFPGDAIETTKSARQFFYSGFTIGF